MAQHAYKYNYAFSWVNLVLAPCALPVPNAPWQASQ